MCIDSTACLAGFCNTNFTCDCLTGYVGLLCSLPIVDETPSLAAQWLAVRIITCLVQSSIFVLSLVFSFQYWYLGKVPYLKFSREMVALLFISCASICAVLSLSIDPFRYNVVRQGLKVSEAYNGGLQLFANLAIAFIACAYGVLIAHWITIRTARTAVKGWSKPAYRVFILVTTLNLVIAFVCSWLEGYLGRSYRYIFFGWVGVYSLTVGVFVIYSGIRTIQQISKFKSERTKGRMRRLANQLVFTGLAAIGGIICILCASVINAEQPLIFIWVRNWVPLFIQMFVNSNVLHIFRTTASQGQLDKSASGTVSATSAMSAASTTQNVNGTELSELDAEYL